jgi:putative transposase
MSKIRKGSHTVSRLTVHMVWATKYRYNVLTGSVKVRCRELIIQDCNSMNIEILSGVVSTDHVHVHLEYPPKLSISMIAKQLKGRSSSLLQKEYPTSLSIQLTL